MYCISYLCSHKLLASVTGTTQKQPMKRLLIKKIPSYSTNTLDWTSLPAIIYPVKFSCSSFAIWTHLISWTVVLFPEHGVNCQVCCCSHGNPVLLPVSAIEWNLNRIVFDFQSLGQKGWLRENRLFISYQTKWFFIFLPFSIRLSYWNAVRSASDGITCPGTTFSIDW